MVDDPKSFYTQQTQVLAAQVEKLANISRIGGTTRGLLFLVMGSFFFLAFFQYLSKIWLWWSLFGVAAVCFLFAVIVHNWIESKRQSKQVWQDFFQQGLWRIDRNWAKIGNPKTWLLAQQHEQAADLFPQTAESARAVSPLDQAMIQDLDLEGKHSLWALVNLARTQMGQETLSRWMTGPASLESSQLRQEAVQALSEDDDWRHPFLLALWTSIHPISSPDKIVRWAIGDPPSPALRALVHVARLNSLVMIGLLIAWFTGGLSSDGLFVSAAVLIGVNFLISVVTAATIHEIFRQVGARAADVAQYRELLAMAENAPAQPALIQQLKRDLLQIDSNAQTATGSGYRQKMDRLVTWSTLANLRGGVFFPLYVVLQFGFLWDLHLLDRLENWRLRCGTLVPRWFGVLGQFESLAALAQFRFDHPQYTFPRLLVASGTAAKITAKQLGHPLLGRESVTNDLQLGRPQITLLVTGSNMSGKSTYLRAIGVNLILGRMGAPVFAQDMLMPAIELGTSMRVADSLSDGISFFMSELRRLKQIVDQAKASNPDTDQHRQFVFLLDEILQGTNSQERQIAVTRVIQKFLRQQAIGALSTHDLQLPEVPELANCLDIVHFKESFETVDGQKRMVFDYKMRPGITPTTNALKLLALVGLDEDE